MIDKNVIHTMDGIRQTLNLLPKRSLLALNPIKPLIDAIESLIDAFEPLVDEFEPLIDDIESPQNLDLKLFR
ncbi:MAG: hypothetical protein OXR64_11320 [Chloroflexota bacterium]|nr:hypothetical protein [Chloroflexota bacterium]MDE2920415.1 hypothetical protein [Chloroflexota bacterium]